MKLTRRKTLGFGFGVFASALVLPRLAMAATVDEMIAIFTGDATVGEGDITLTAPEIAENGNTVPVAVAAPGATAIMLLASGNPNPAVCTFNFGALMPTQVAATRIRLSGTQDVIAIARMADGSFIQTSQEVKVTIGGCGG